MSNGGTYQMRTDFWKTRNCSLQNPEQTSWNKGLTQTAHDLIFDAE
jgi:hypothetical protein